MEPDFPASETPAPGTPAPRMVGADGHFDGQWFTEEDVGTSRFSIRVEGRLHHEKSRYQDIAVYESIFFGRVLALDDLVMFTERDEFVYHEMLTHLPLCSMPEPESLLVIGGGDCGILREAFRHPSIRRAVQCEIDERVTRVCAEHFSWVEPIMNDPRAELVFDDGITYIEKHQGEFDLIVIDSTDPIGPAVGLFHRDFYLKVARALRPGGVMVAQTESPHWGAGMVGTIYGQLRESFRHVHAYMGCIPTYPSGTWCWAYASNDRTPATFFDAERARRVSTDCRYYNPDLQIGAFMLPTFARKAVEGDNVFARFDRPNRERLARDTSRLADQ